MVARIVLALYPPAVRERYGDEISLLMESSPTPHRDLLNVFWHALLDRTEYAVTLSWRRAPRFLLFGAAWLVGAYAFLSLTDAARGWIIQAVIPNPAPIPVFSDDVSQMRLITALCIVAAGGLAFALARRWWRGAVWLPVVALAFVSIVLNVVRVETYRLTSFDVTVDWDWFGWTLGEQLLWAASVLALIVAIRRAPAGWAGVVAGFGVLAVAYGNTVVSTFLLDRVFDLPGNPWTTYWESIMGAVFDVRTSGDVGVFVQTNGWWPTVATALVAGCAMAARALSRKTSVLGRPYAA
jgi:hypothetical protein